MSNQVTGRAFISLNGVRLRSQPGATLNPGGFNRETKIGDVQIDGYSESIAAPSVECTIHHKADTSLTELANMRDVPLTFETDTGKVFLLRGAWCANPPSLSSGNVPLRFEALSCEES